MKNYKESTISAFFALLRAGLWETEVRLEPYGKLDYSEVYRLASEQSVVGLIAAGLEHVVDVKVPQGLSLTIAGDVLQIEKRNRGMNLFVASLFDHLRRKGIYVVLVKGQGVAQCYERPLWRASGDVDLFLDEVNFIKARECLRPRLTVEFDPTDDYARNISAKIGNWDIELHANQNSTLSSDIDNCLKLIQEEVLSKEGVRSWENEGIQVKLPEANRDILIVFTHFLKHFYKGGLGLRQICDWIRLIWTYRNSLDLSLLSQRLDAMRLKTEWKAFAMYAVTYLGMPEDIIPFYERKKRWESKAVSINTFVLKVGNMGHNRDNSMYGKSFLIRKLLSFGRKCDDLAKHALIFPFDSFRFFIGILANGIRHALRGN